MKLLVLLFHLFPFAVYAQIHQPTLLSIQGIGGDRSDRVSNAVTKTIDGGFILSIGTNSSIGSGNIGDYASCTNSSNYATSFIKYNADGSSIDWKKCYYGDGDSAFLYLFPTTNNKFILGGMFNPLSSGLGFLIAKQDEFGNILWQKNYSKDNGAVLRGMIETKDKGYLMMGESFYVDSNVLTHYGAWTDADIWLLKVDSNGNKQWSKVIGGTAAEDPRFLVELPDGSIYLGGSTGSNDYDCTGFQGGYNDLYIVRLTKDGNIIWHRDIGGTNNDGGSSAVLDGKGGLIIAGSSFSIDGDVSHPTADSGGVWLVNVDSSGDIIWNESYGGRYCYPNSVCRCTNGDIWAACVSSNQGDYLDNGYGRDDAWILHADSVGGFINARILGSDMNDEAMMVFPLSNGNVMAGGAYQAKNNSFSSLDYYGVGAFNNDIFLAVLASQNQTKTGDVFDIRKHVKIFPNPGVNQITIEPLRAGSYQLHFFNAIGNNIYGIKISKALTINIDCWKKGLYSVRIVDENGIVQIQKLLIE